MQDNPATNIRSLFFFKNGQYSWNTVSKTMRGKICVNLADLVLGDLTVWADRFHSQRFR